MSEVNQSRFLTTSEAATLACVSIETISKYKDLGLLRAFRVNGQEQFREDEIKLVFNSKSKNTSTNDTSSQNSQTDSHAQIQESNTNQTQMSSSEEPPTLNDILSDEPNLSQDQTSSTPHEPQTEFVKNKENTGDFRHFDIPSIELLELTRSLKDQLETIKEERNWLRRRVEKLESSIEREQMITISKTEAMRNLIEQNRPQKSPWAFLLPWNKQ